MNDFNRALSQLAQDPNSPEANLKVAFMYHEQSQTAAALSYYMRCAERTTDTEMAYSCLLRSAQCFEAQGNRAVSVRSLIKRALVLLPRRPEAYWYLARFNEQQSQYSDCYLLCCVAQEFCDLNARPLMIPVGYPGTWALKFQRSIAAWWWGMNQESRDGLRDLLRHHWWEMDSKHRRSLVQNLQRINMEQEFFEQEYQQACEQASDINEHLPTLRRLAEEVEYVTEMGVRAGVSTRAFLASNRVLRSYDICLDAGVQQLFDLANGLGRNAVYQQANVLEIGIDETDLLFIDTLHNADQLTAELLRHSDRVRKYIVLHDTETFGYRDEVGPGPGLKSALDQWLPNHPQWRIKQHYSNNNGLTVLARC
jgi:tetratricopeptide (TPR) repeat protein